MTDFQSPLDRFNDIARRAPSYVWHIENEDMEAAQLDAGGPMGGNPRTASPLSVWDDAGQLLYFVMSHYGLWSHPHGDRGDGTLSSS